MKALALFLLALIGTLSHPAFDWLNNYGIRLLEPFSSQWFYGDSIFIIDLWMWIGLGTAVWLSRKREKAQAPHWTSPARTAIVGVLAYLAFNIGLTFHVEEGARAALAREGVNPTLVVASPVPVLFWQREVFWRDKDRYGRGSFSPADGVRVSLDSAPLGMTDPRIAVAASERADVAAFLFWARMPFAFREGNAIIIADQRFDNQVTRDRFTVRVD